MIDLTGKTVLVRGEYQGVVKGVIAPGLLAVVPDGSGKTVVLNLYSAVAVDILGEPPSAGAGNAVEAQAAVLLEGRLPMPLSRACDRLSKFGLLSGSRVDRYHAWRSTFLGIESGALGSMVFEVVEYVPEGGGRPGHRVQFKTGQTP